ncbi:pyridoxamine 5'-phosphate oxidase family protein [Rhizobium sp. AAP43]|uniref:pyridoxamine 5'-phosphate oxidase family protein n=1 Tax=Rhizobium sp. AAP43 TaxID=1523420 RepID=UPI0006B9C989|nr:pyridoxamine 5'-phosphate oxidase family protein [Rhizobium sp. AAP43]KPF46909.1 pyridoxamine 5'-phosphate oxidase [Rhizobium sp. AAP43]
MSNRYQVDPDHVIGDEAQLRALFEPTHALALRKCQSQLGVHAQAFIRRAPFLCIGTQNPEGKADVSPRGDPAGFVQILDPQTIAIPDRPGNNRLDTLSNIIANPAVGLLFIIPGFDDTLRLNGRAQLSTDPVLLQRMAVDGKVPKLAIVVAVDEVFLHCAKAFRRSHLWDPDYLQVRREMPSLMKFILDETSGAPNDANEMRKLDDDLEQAYQRTMY